MTDQPPIEPYEPRPGEIDPAVRRLAKKRLEARREFRQHLASYAIVMAGLVMIWVLSGGGYFWPIWPMLGWGIGIAFHALSLRDSGITEQQIAAEAAKIEAQRQKQRPRPPLEGPQDTI